MAAGWNGHQATVSHMIEELSTRKESTKSKLLKNYKKKFEPLELPHIKPLQFILCPVTPIFCAEIGSQCYLWLSLASTMTSVNNLIWGLFEHPVVIFLQYYHTACLAAQNTGLNLDTHISSESPHSQRSPGYSSQDKRKMQKQQYYGVYYYYYKFIIWGRT